MAVKKGVRCWNPIFFQGYTQLAESQNVVSVSNRINVGKTILNHPYVDDLYHPFKWWCRGCCLFFNHIRPFSGREGDQDLFKYVIDYHRDRSLHPRAELFQLVVVKNYLHLLSGNLT